MTNPQFLNANQVYETFGLPRGALARLVDAGRLRVRIIEDEAATLKLYSVEDLEKIVNGEADHEQV